MVPADGSFLRPEADLVRAARDEAARLAARVFRAVIITALFGVVMFAAAPILCTVIFGDEFRDSVGMLRILIVASLGVTTIKLLGSALVARGSLASRAWPSARDSCASCSTSC